MKNKEPIFSYSEKRDVAVTVRLPASVVKKLKKISKEYNHSQSKVIEIVLNKAWNESKNDQGK